MKTLSKWIFWVLAPLLVATSFAACASTPKCDNDACYNRRLSSVNKGDEDAEDREDDVVIKQDARSVFFHDDGFRRE